MEARKAWKVIGSQEQCLDTKGFAFDSNLENLVALLTNWANLSRSLNPPELQFSHSWNAKNI